ncbi:MAG: hypothetical protein IJ165_14735 [Proteobacteria bacterium]|nr:hypothetical protein [Pseudomonadota bacterium]
MRIRTAMLGIISLFLPVLASAQEIYRTEPLPEDAALPDRYEITVDAARGALRVRAQLSHIAREETVCLPAFGQRFGETLQIVQIRTDQNVPMVAKLDRAGCISRVTAARCDFEYELIMSELPPDRFWLPSELSPSRNGKMLVFPGESLFIERGANETSTHASLTDVRVTDGGQIVTTLAPVLTPNGPANTQDFEAQSHYELTRSFWAFQVPKLLAASSEDLTWQLAFDPLYQTDIADIERELSQILGFYSDLMRTKTPTRIAIFLFDIPFDAHYTHGFARQGGIVLEMGRKAARDKRARRILMAHELFHLYNGENLRFENKSFAQTAWFREGMTQYIALTALLSLGLASRDDLYLWMSLSLSKQKPGVYDPYHHGFFLSLAIEQQWQRYQSGLSMPGFWRFLSLSPNWNEHQSNTTLQALLAQYSAFDFNSFFKRYVRTTAELPLEEILAVNGLTVQKQLKPQPSIGMEYGLDAAKAILYVKKILRNSPAERAGLKPGDWIVPADATDWSDASDKQITVIRDSQRLQMRIPAITVSAETTEIRPVRP